MYKRLIHPKAIIIPLLFLALIWGGFLIQHIGLVENCDGAIIPLNPSGVKGIFFSPFLHGNLDHILGNSLPLALSSFLLYQFYSSIADKVVLYGWLSSGLAVWIIPTSNLIEHPNCITCIIGASGLIYVLAFFLFTSGVIRPNIKRLTISLFISLYYGSMIWKIFPKEHLFTLNEPDHISWKSHLTGAIIGIIIAFIYKNKEERKKEIYFI